MFQKHLSHEIKPHFYSCHWCFQTMNHFKIQTTEFIPLTHDNVSMISQSRFNAELRMVPGLSFFLFLMLNKKKHTELKVMWDRCLFNQLGISAIVTEMSSHNIHENNIFVSNSS